MAMEIYSLHIYIFCLFVVAALISEIYVNGRKQDFWCETNTIISDELRTVFKDPVPRSECDAASCLFYRKEPSVSDPARLHYPRTSTFMCENTARYAGNIVSFVCQ